MVDNCNNSGGSWVESECKKKKKNNNNNKENYLVLNAYVSKVAVSRQTDDEIIVINLVVY